LHYFADFPFSYFKAENRKNHFADLVSFWNNLLIFHFPILRLKIGKIILPILIFLE
jgi:hypothetical protein